MKQAAHRLVLLLLPHTPTLLGPGWLVSKPLAQCRASTAQLQAGASSGWLRFYGPSPPFVSMSRPLLAACRSKFPSPNLPLSPVHTRLPSRFFAGARRHGVASPRGRDSPSPAESGQAAGATTTRASEGGRAWVGLRAGFRWESWTTGRFLSLCRRRYAAVTVLDNPPGNIPFLLSLLCRLLVQRHALYIFSVVAFGGLVGEEVFVESECIAAESDASARLQDRGFAARQFLRLTQQTFALLAIL